MNAKSLTLFFVIFLIVSCTYDYTSNSVYQVNLSSRNELSDLITGCEVISLEARSECMISNVDRMRVDSSYYYLQDGNAICVFDHTGNFVSKISRFGRAENEYMDITDFYVHNGYIYVLSNPQRKILIYTLDATNIDTVYLNDWYHNLYVDEERILLYSEHANSSKFDIVEINHEGEIIERYLPFKIDSGTLYGYSPFNNVGDAIHLTFPYDHRIMSLSAYLCENISNIKVEGCRILTDKELKNLSYDDIKKLLVHESYIKRITGITQKGNKLFITMDLYLKNKGIRICISKIDIQTGNTTSYLCGEEIDENYPYFSRLMYMDNDIVYSVVDPLYIHNVNKIIYSDVSDSFEDLIKNPSIYKYRINWD